ncbi:Uncharacterized membrane protein YccC [Methylocella tundrae]|nr:Uncharacterized membrane protein YccC [Methylocella tundrae]
MYKRQLLTLAIALWVSVCLYFSLLDRTPRSYLLMLAGYTAALIGFPAVDSPGAIFDTAVARAEEITLGILCASLVSAVVLPQSAASAIARRLELWLRYARAWVIDVFSRFRMARDTQSNRLLLAAEAVAFEALATPLRYDMSGAERSADAMATLRQHMLMFLPIVSSISDRIETLERAGMLPSAIQSLLSDMSDWLASGGVEPAVAKKLRDRASAADPDFGPETGWGDLILASLIARMRDFIDLRQDTRVLQRHIEDGSLQREQLVFRYTATARTIRHRDHGMALLSAIGAFIAILATCLIWIATGWPDGSAAPMMAAVGCCFFAAQDDPAPHIISFANSAILGAIGAGAYLFAILPLATSFEMLALALAPGLLICGVFMTQLRTAPLAMGAAVNGATMIAIQNGYKGDFAPFINSAVAVIAGVWAAAVVTRLVRSVGGAWSARRLRRINRQSLVREASEHGSQHGLELAALMLDRVGLIAPRLAALPPDDAEWTADLLAEVRIGINLVELRRVRASLSSDARSKIEHILDVLARHFRTDANEAPKDLLAVVDAGLDAAAAEGKRAENRSALLGLIGLRRALFPNAPPYHSTASKTVRPEFAA